MDFSEPNNITNDALLNLSGQNSQIIKFLIPFQGNLAHGVCENDDLIGSEISTITT